VTSVTLPALLQQCEFGGILDQVSNDVIGSGQAIHRGRGFFPGPPLIASILSSGLFRAAPHRDRLSTNHVGSRGPRPRLF
jgi:hypothetical protein